jgi:hypothetical protein
LADLGLSVYGNCRPKANGRRKAVVRCASTLGHAHEVAPLLNEIGRSAAEGGTFILAYHFRMSIIGVDHERTQGRMINYTVGLKYRGF